MKTFAFRLERVLHWRATSLKVEKAKLEPIRARLEHARAELEKLVQALYRAKQTAREHPVSGADLQALESYSAAVEREIGLMGGNIVGHEQAVEKQKQVVAVCDRNVRLLERLRSRRKVEWQSEHDQELEALSSDYSAAQWSRERQSGEQR